MITTWLFPQFVEYQGGIESINRLVETDDLENPYTITQLTAVASFIPVLNILSALPLIYWYICIPKS
jgi:hypothetical protein